jgi:hypothetical protein
MRTRFRFKSAVVTIDSGQTWPLATALADLDGPSRRPVRLRLRSPSGRSRKHITDTVTIELSRGEAYALSEWLDGVVTAIGGPPRRGSDPDHQRTQD